jgi:hypothetical protein
MKDETYLLENGSDQGLLGIRLGTEIDERVNVTVASK